MTTRTTGPRTLVDELHTWLLTHRPVANGRCGDPSCRRAAASSPCQMRIAAVDHLIVYRHLEAGHRQAVINGTEWCCTDLDLIGDPSAPRSRIRPDGGVRTGQPAR